jgi:GGDEF domain-containing protein
MPKTTPPTDAELRVPAAAAPRGEPPIPFRLQRLEPYVGIAATVLAAWLAMFLHGGGTEPVWWLGALAAAVSVWAQAFPARRLSLMFGRGLALQAGGLLLLAVPGAGGPLGAALIWPLGVGVGYALLLPTRWSTPLIALGVAAFAAACVAAEPAPPWQAAFALGGSLAIVPMLTLAMGRTLRASERQVEQARLDTRSNLSNDAGFFSNGAELFADCRRRKLPFSLVLLEATDLRDVDHLLGRRSANALFAQTVRAISAAVPAGGLAARTDTVEFALAMPGLDVEKAEALVHQRLGRPPQVKVQLSGAEAAIVLDVVVAQAPPELHTIEELYDSLHQRLRRRVAPAATQPTSGHGSTLKGFFLEDPPVPMDRRPTLPMALPHRKGGRRKGGRPSRPSSLPA